MCFSFLHTAITFYVLELILVANESYEQGLSNDTTHEGERSKLVRG